MALITTVAGGAVSAVRARLEQMRERASRDMVETCLIETSQVMTAAMTALLALAMGRKPLDAEVQEEPGNLAEDPASVHRWHRHWTEILKSPSPDRRRRVASVLAVGPKITRTPEDRDRLDLLVEQLLEEDIVTLKAIVDVVREKGGGEWPLGFDVVRTQELPKYGIVVKQAHTGLEVDPLSFDRLAGAQCISRGSISWTEVTSLGEFLVTHMDHEAIRAGVGSGDADKAV